VAPSPPPHPLPDVLRHRWRQGLGGPDLYSDETWEWNGTFWTRIVPAQSPSARRRHAAAFDQRHDEMLVFGGWVQSAQHDTTFFRSVIDPGTVLEQPRSLAVGEGQFAAFGVTAAGQSLNYQWLKDGQEIAGATTATLLIPGAGLEDAGAYTVRLTGQCGTVFTDQAVLTVTPICHADFNGDGQLNLFDFLTFQAAFGNGC